MSETFVVLCRVPRPWGTPLRNWSDRIHRRACACQGQLGRVLAAGRAGCWQSSPRLGPIPRHRSAVEARCGSGRREKTGLPTIARGQVVIPGSTRLRRRADRPPPTAPCPFPRVPPAASRRWPGRGRCRSGSPVRLVLCQCRVGEGGQRRRRANANARRMTGVVRRLGWRWPIFRRGLPPEYRQRCGVSLPCSGWERVGPPRSNHQRREHCRTTAAFRASGGGGAEGDRTPDLRLAKAALSQLSYGPGWGIRPGGPRRTRCRTSLLPSVASAVGGRGQCRR